MGVTPQSFRQDDGIYFPWRADQRLGDHRSAVKVTREDGLSWDSTASESCSTGAPVCIHEIDADGRLLAMNPAGLALLGAASEDAMRGATTWPSSAPPTRTGFDA